ncbi:D-amino acid dehydrogenase [Variovorax sp. PCZ-1]|nr:D-amino acid dehydrogenase [Variovorax sp. PCZ-1]
MHIVVIGAGIVGCATAYQLLRDGHTVELVDAQAEAGRVSSFANGAQLSYSYVEPLASPATLRALPKLLFEKDSALKFTPRLDWRQWAWGLHFLAACRAAQTQSGTSALLELAQLSRQTLDAWMSEQAWEIDFARNGKLVLCRDEKSLALQAAQVRLQKSMGSKQEVLNAKQCIEREPALAASQSAFVGGVWTASECMADPYKLCQNLVQRISTKAGVLRFSTQVQSIELRQGRFHALHTSCGKLQADACVISSGATTPAICEPLGIRLPIYPIKGYSLTVPVIQPERVANCSITDLGLKTVFAPLGNNLRVAAAAEIVGHDLTVAPKRVEQMLQATESLFPGACDLSQPLTWAGLRPATPSSLPIIGASRVPNVFINAGQGALGLTLAAGSAARLSKAISQG